MTISFDPLVDVRRTDPYPLYRELRDSAPVSRAPHGEVYSVARYDDVQTVLRTPELYSSRAMLTVLLNTGPDAKLPLTPSLLLFAARLMIAARLNPFVMFRHPSLIASDGARHDALRAIVNRGFTPRRIASWEARSRAIVADCVAKLDRGEPFDLVEDLAVPLPVTMISEMLGIEAERRRDFKRWSDTLISATTGAGRADPFAPANLSQFFDLITYLSRVARTRRDAPADDLISTLVSDRDGAALHPQDVMQFVTLLLIAGNETTTNLIGNSVNALLDHPDQLARVAANPELVPDLIEEAVRFDSPVQLVFRTATAESQLAGVRIPKGATVVALLASANRDERRFPDGERFDVARRPQGHFGFGFGKHFCLGASLARLEARSALEALVPRLGRLQKNDAQPPRLDSFLVRGPARLLLRAA
ncbi:MAG TPA: cytochrome P450 [Myxococcota bacterium]